MPYAFTNLAGLPGVLGSDDGAGTAARFNYPAGIAFDSAGNVYIADVLNHTIRKMTPAGLVTTLAGSAGLGGTNDGMGASARFNRPHGLDLDSAGNCYVADTDSHTIRKITAAGQVTTLAGSPGFFGTNDGIGNSARFHQPEGVAVDSAGNVYVGDALNNTIRKISPAGVVTTLAGSPGETGSQNGTGSAARVSPMNGLAVDSAGNVYVADSGNNMIRRVSPSGVVTTVAGSAQAGSADGNASDARFYGPSGVALDSAGNVYVTDQGNYTIRRIAPDGTVRTLAGTVSQPGSADGIGSSARFDSPFDLAVDAAGTVYLTDGYNNRRITKGILLQTNCTPSPSGLVSWWPGDGNPQDAVGTNNGVLQSGATFAAGKVGQAFVLDPSHHFVDLGAWHPGPQWTVEAWINPAGSNVGAGLILGNLADCRDWGDYCCQITRGCLPPARGLHKIAF